MKNKWLAILLYSYSLLHILGWIIFGYSNHNEAWFPIFDKIYFIGFMPLNIPTFWLCGLFWGSINIFKANYIVGPIFDFSVCSIFTVSVILLFVIIIRKLVNHLTTRST